MEILEPKSLRLLNKGDIKGKPYGNIILDESGIVQANDLYIRLIKKKGKALHIRTRIPRYIKLDQNCNYEVAGIVFKPFSNSFDLTSFVKTLYEEGYRVSIAFRRAQEVVKKYGR